MVNFTILAGGYSSAIVTYLFNSQTSTLSVAGQYPTGQNPSWLTLHPTNKNVLYAVNEIYQGALQSFTVSSSGVVSSPVSTVSSGGDSPAFAVALSSGQVAVVNYGGGNGRIIPTTDPLHFDNSAAVLTFPKPTGVSHPHEVLQNGNELLVPDLGGDTIYRLVQNGSPGNWKIQGSIPQPKGSGPRHIALYNNYLYTLHELSSTLTSQQLPAAPNGTSSIIASSYIVPSNPPSGAVWAAGEVHIPEISSAFPTPYIFASNRNTGASDSRGDSIAVYKILSGGGLQQVNQVYTGLNQVRGMEFSPVVNGEQYVVAAGVAGSAGVAVFKRDNGGAGLTLVARNTQIQTRTSFVWL